MCSTAIRTSSARRETHTGSATMLWRSNAPSYLKQQLGSCNIEDMLKSAYGQTRIEMTEKEKELFRKSLVDKLRITMDTEGNLSIGLS